MNLLSYPFRLSPNGNVATVEQDTDEHRAEMIAVLLLTRIGERPLSPSFGVTDMVGEGLNENELAAAVATFGPETTLLEVQIDPVAQDTQRVTVTFE